MMKKVIVMLAAAVLLAACADSDSSLRRRAAELCKYVPDHELSEAAANYMTPDFYSALDTMFNHLPEFEAMDHEWLYYFVTSNGGTIADFEVTGVEKTDDTHAVATILVRQKWDDGSFDPESDVEEHQLYMEKVDGQWLMSDFDNHKEDCVRNIEISRQEQAVRDAVSDYLIKEVAPNYLQGELCIPTLLIVAAEEDNSGQARLWCDTWVSWYNVAGDTLKTVSGGNHSGCMSIVEKDGKPVVTGFEQTVDGAGNIASAKRIFGSHYDIYQNIRSNPGVMEAARGEQLKEYVRRSGTGYRYYQDYGWDAVEF